MECGLEEAETAQAGTGPTVYSGGTGTLQLRAGVCTGWLVQEVGCRSGHVEERGGRPGRADTAEAHGGAGASRDLTKGVWAVGGDLEEAGCREATGRAL